eukprot:11372441-Heterocapsa_arctica.AAC.1
MECFDGGELLDADVVAMVELVEDQSRPLVNVPCGDAGSKVFLRNWVPGGPAVRQSCCLLSFRRHIMWRE